MAARVRLVRKLAEMINGIDLSAARVGDEIELPEQDAQMLIAEGWAAYCLPERSKAIVRRGRRRRRRDSTS